MEKLVSHAYKEVKTKSNFYFRIDEHKKDSNLKVYNVRAPGNKHRKPYVMLPHEHVHITHYLETEGLTEDKMKEIYAYYSYMIDLHIS